MITSENVINELLTDELIVQSYVYSYKSVKYWKIQKPLTIELSNGKIINIEKGFTYDTSSVPKIFWSILRPVNDGLVGYLIHDWLYINKHKHNMSQWECDDEMLFWTNITNSNKLDNYVRWFIVKYVAGWWVWYRVSNRLKSIFKKLI